MAVEGKKCMRTSVSAIINAEGCVRRWWFDKGHKLPTPQRKATIFGDIQHSVNERWLNADDKGLDKKTGQPLVLYPKDWYKMKERWSKSDTVYSISENEQALVKLMTKEAIDMGILIRDPTRKVEERIDMPIDNIHDNVYALIVGYIDLHTRDAVIDHKTTGNIKYALSKEALKKSIQMVGYALYHFMGCKDNSVKLVHNVFATNLKLHDRGPEVRQTSTTITRKEVADFCTKTILPLLRTMADIYYRYPNMAEKGEYDIKTLKKFREIPATEDVKNNCQFHYGKPCPYADICSGAMTVDSWLKCNANVKQTPIIGETKMNGTLLNLINKNNTKTTPVETGGAEKKLSVMQKLMKKPATPDVVVAEEIEPIAPIEEPQTVIEPEVEDDDAVEMEIMTDAPWAVEGCPACAIANTGTPGITATGEPCNVCDARSKIDGGFSSTDFVTTTSGDGSVTYINAEYGISYSTPGKVCTSKVKEEVLPVEVEDEFVEAVEEPVVATLKGKKGLLTHAGTSTKENIVVIPPDPVEENASGFNLYLGCSCVQGCYMRSLTNAQSLLDEIVEEAPNNIAKDPFRMKDFVAAVCVEWAKDGKYTGSIFSPVPPNGTLLHIFVNTLRNYADNVFTPVQ